MNIAEELNALAAFSEPDAAAILRRAAGEHSAMLAALRAIVAVLDGRQPKDPIGALMVAQSALARIDG